MAILHSPALWVALLVTAAIVAIAVIKRRDTPKQWGFREVVKNPIHWAELNQARREAENAAADTKNWSDDEVSSAARHFIFDVTSSREAWGEARVLRELGDRVHQSVVEILGNPTLYSRLIEPSNESVLPETPFMRACDLLGNAPPESATAKIAPFLVDSSKEIRKNAALVIAKTGSPLIVPHIRRALLDSDEYVRSYALMGLEFALKRKGLATNVSTELFTDVRDLLEQGKNADNAAEILFQFDSERAKQYFLSPRVFRPESPILHEVLETLADAKASVQRDRLLEMISALEAEDLTYPRNYSLREALRLLGQQQNAADQQFLTDRTAHDDADVSAGASAGLLCFHGLDGFDKRIWEAVEKAGYESLHSYQQFYIAVIVCNSEINNGGFAQYFFNSSGDHWQDALAGFEATGSKERLALLRQAIEFFGPAGPSEDREKRQLELSRIYKKNDGVFEELESRYYKSSENVDVLTTRFVLANPDHFR